MEKRAEDEKGVYDVTLNYIAREVINVLNLTRVRPTLAPGDT